MAATKTLIQRPWNPTAASGLSSALGDDLPMIADEIKAGRAALYEVPGRGWMVFRREGSELVCIAAEGRGLLPVFAAIVEQTNAQTVRVHSSRAGMGRMLAPLGFREAERVYRMEK